MLKIFKTIYLLINNLIRLIDSLIPAFIKLRLDAEFYSINNFMQYASKVAQNSDKVLDAGGGGCPYKRYFSHTNYESTDFENIFDTDCKKIHTFICSLDYIPKPDNSYDIIINTQVLEHVENPQIVINEFYRILKPSGKLFLTAPQGWGIHGEPYHFFNFTNYGLKSLFTKAGFKIKFIKPRGGIFWYLGNRIKTLPFYILSQYPVKRDNNKLNPLHFLIWISYILILPFCNFLIPILFFYLDKLDEKRNYTLGYACYCIKD